MMLLITDWWFHCSCCAGLWLSRQLLPWGTQQGTTMSTINPLAPSLLSSHLVGPEHQVGPVLHGATLRLHRWWLTVCRLSSTPGTNDKPGGPHYVLRWTSPQVVKQTHVPLKDWRYPYMGWERAHPERSSSRQHVHSTTLVFALNLDVKVMIEWVVLLPSRLLHIFYWAVSNIRPYLKPFSNLEFWSFLLLITN